jgi:hypothetical protein
VRLRVQRVKAPENPSDVPAHPMTREQALQAFRRLKESLDTAD